jgi:hypothetical protein
METGPGFDGRVPLRYTCVVGRDKIFEFNKRNACLQPYLAHRVRHILVFLTLSTSVWRFANNDLGNQKAIERGYILYSGLSLTVRGGKYCCWALVLR